MDAIVMSQSVSSPSGAAVSAAAFVGSNGYHWGDYEYGVADGSGDVTSGRVEWDPDLDDGFDTGNVVTTLDATSGGSNFSLVSDSANTGTTSTAAVPNGVSGVYLRAVVDQAGTAEAEWSGIVVKFLRHGQVTETVDVATLDAQGSDSDPTEQVSAYVTPTAGDNDEVIITGTMRLSAAGTDLPSATSLFCQAKVFAGT